MVGIAMVGIAIVGIATVGIAVEGTALPGGWVATLGRVQADATTISSSDTNVTICSFKMPPV